MQSLWFQAEDVVVDEKSLLIFGGCWREVRPFTIDQVTALCEQHFGFLGGVGYVNFFRLQGNRLATVIVKDDGRIERTYGAYELVYITHGGGTPRFFAPKVEK